VKIIFLRIINVILEIVTSSKQKIPFSSWKPKIKRSREMGGDKRGENNRVSGVGPKQVFDFST